MFVSCIHVFYGSFCTLYLIASVLHSPVLLPLTSNFVLRAPTNCGTSGVTYGCWHGSVSVVCTSIWCTCRTSNVCDSSAGTIGASASWSSWTTKSLAWRTCSARWTRTTTDWFPAKCLSMASSTRVRPKRGEWLAAMYWQFCVSCQNSTLHAWKWEPSQIFSIAMAKVWLIGKSLSPPYDQTGSSKSRQTTPTRFTTKWSGWSCSARVDRSSVFSKWAKANTG